MDLRFTKQQEEFQDLGFVDVLEALRPVSQVKVLFQLLLDIGPLESVIGLAQPLPDGADQICLFSVSPKGCKRRDLAIVQPDSAMSETPVGSRVARMYALALYLAYHQSELTPDDIRRTKVMNDLGMPGIWRVNSDNNLLPFAAIFTPTSLNQEEVASGLRPAFAGISPLLVQ